MLAEDFALKRQADWIALDDLIKASQGSVAKLTPSDVETFGRLYRSVTSDLALAQREFPQEKITRYLNQLVSQAHTMLYQPDAPTVKRIINFLTTGFPRLFRETLPFFLVSAAFFILPAIASGIVVANDPDMARNLFGPEVEVWVEDVVATQDQWAEIPVSERPMASTFIMSNNIRVSFLAFAAGILGCIFTLLLLVYNGMLIGVVTGLTHSVDFSFELWTFVIGHGVIELTVIFIAGGAGLILGWAVLRPGLLSRKDAVIAASQKAVRLIVMAVPLLMIAGAIEGFISPAETIPWPVKWSIGLISGVLLYSYLFLAGRRQPQR